MQKAKCTYTYVIHCFLQKKVVFTFKLLHMYFCSSSSAPLSLWAIEATAWESLLSFSHHFGQWSSFFDVICSIIWLYYGWKTFSAGRISRFLDSSVFWLNIGILKYCPSRWLPDGRYVRDEKYKQFRNPNLQPLKLFEFYVYMLLSAFNLFVWTPHGSSTFPVNY